MKDMAEWLEEKLSEGAHYGYAIHFALGAFRSEADNNPDKVYTSSEVAKILEIISNN